MAGTRVGEYLPPAGKEAARASGARILTGEQPRDSNQDSETATEDGQQQNGQDSPKTAHETTAKTARETTNQTATEARRTRGGGGGGEKEK